MFWRGHGFTEQREEMRNAGITVEERRFQHREPAAFGSYAAMKWPLFHGDTQMLGLIQADEVGK